MVDFINPIQQQYPDTCAIKSQQLILQDFGIDVSETECVQYCYDHGWYVPGGGTLPENVGKLLVDVGIPCTQRVDANIFDIMNEIQQGHKVIVGVDANELWNDGPINSIIEWLRDIFVGEQANHALIVAGLDYSDPEHPYVILTDPGSGEAGKPYPLDQFMDAWSDSQHFIVSTDIPTPKVTNEFINSGQTDLHLPEVAGVDYDTFIDFYNYSNQPEFNFTQMPTLYNAFDTFPMNPGWDFNDALSFANLPPISSVDIPIPAMDLGLPVTPVFDPQQQLEMFQNTMMDVQHNMTTLFPDVSFMPDPIFQYPTLDISGMDIGNMSMDF
ncbi:MAG: hypothetical protein J1F40_09185 [Prevotellaceae bacterium]|nr:hypothetical protein [Prevotellaceae bacterium]